jgi:hypothetical protein
VVAGLVIASIASGCSADDGRVAWRSWLVHDMRLTPEQAACIDHYTATDLTPAMRSSIRRNGFGATPPGRAERLSEVVAACTLATPPQ